jgi:hypothetical protein
LIEEDEDIYLTKSDKLNDEANVKSWFAPFDSRDILAIVSIIGGLGAILAINTTAQSSKIRSLLMGVSIAARGPVAEAFPMNDIRQLPEPWNDIFITAMTQILVIIAAYLAYQTACIIYLKIKHFHIRIPLQNISDYRGHTTSICIEAMDHKSILLIPLCSIKSHPIDLMTENRFNLRVTNYSKHCLFDSITFNINETPLITKSTNNILRLTDTAHVSMFDRILLRKISSHMCSYSLLRITNGIAREIDLSDTPSQLEIADESHEYAVMD